jgi:transposase
MPSIAIGVDTGKTQHQAAAVDSDHGHVRGQLRFRVDRDGFERFCAFVQEQVGSQPVVIGLEATGHYHLTLLEFLQARGYCVILLNPYQVPSSDAPRASVPRPIGSTRAPSLSSCR